MRRPCNDVSKDRCENAELTVRALSLRREARMGVSDARALVVVVDLDMAGDAGRFNEEDDGESSDARSASVLRDRDDWSNEALDAPASRCPKIDDASE